MASKPIRWGTEYPPPVKPIQWGSGNGLSTPVAAAPIQWGGGGGLSTPVGNPITYPGGRTGVSGETTDPTGIGLQVELSADGTMWRYTVPGSGWYSPWTSSTTPPGMALPSGAGQTTPGGGGGSTGGYWDRNYGAWRQGGELQFKGSMNQWGQPAGTPGPYLQSGSRGGKHGSPSAPTGPTDYGALAASTQASIDYWTARQQNQQPFRGRTREGGGPNYGNTLSMLYNRLAMLQQKGGLGGNAGTQSGVAGAMVRWTP